MMTKEKILEACEWAESIGVGIMTSSYFKTSVKGSYERVCPINACMLKKGLVPSLSNEELAIALGASQLEVRSFIEGVDDVIRNPDVDGGIDGPSYMLGKEVRAAIESAGK